jgi:hypothetical protein
LPQRFTTISNFVGCSIGKSMGWAPRAINELGPPPIINWGWFQAVAITDRLCKSFIRKANCKVQYGGTRL